MLRAIRAAYPASRPLPSRNAWRKFSDDDVWIPVLTQVAVVGRADPGKALWAPGIRRRIAWRRISRMPRSMAAKAIWEVLREVGARYVGRTVSTCRKTAAMVRNLAFLKTYSGGPRRFVRDLAQLEGASDLKVAIVSKHLSFIKSKGARDLLTTGFGLTTDHIALDSRVVGALEHLGIKLPLRATSDPVVYEAVERKLVREICRPLGMTASELDQLLFYNYAEIKRKF